MWNTQQRRAALQLYRGPWKTLSTKGQEVGRTVKLSLYLPGRPEAAGPARLTYLIKLVLETLEQIRL